MVCPLGVCLETLDDKGSSIWITFCPNDRPDPAKLVCLVIMNKPFKNPTEDEIDEVVTAQADDDSAWEKPIRVQRQKGDNDVDENKPPYCQL